MPGIVIESKKAVYWPIPKNACTAIKKAIACLPEYGRDPRDKESIHDFAFRWTADPIPGFTDLAVIRHPLERLYSLWTNKIAAGHPVGPRFVNGMDVDVFGGCIDRVRDGMPFNDFVSVVLSMEPADPHWAPQCTQYPPGAHLIKLDEVRPLLQIILESANVSHIPTLQWREAYSQESNVRAVRYYDQDLRTYELYE